LDQARRLTRDEKRDRAYRNGAVFLRTLGITSQTELTRVLDLAMNPNSLFRDNSTKLRGNNASARLLDVETDMRPTVEYLTTLGLSYNQIKQIILMHPPVLSYSAKERIQPFIAELKEFGIEEPVRVIERRPSLLGLTNRDNIRSIVTYLLENGSSLEEVTELLCTTI